MMKILISSLMVLSSFSISHSARAVELEPSQIQCIYEVAPEAQCDTSDSTDDISSNCYRSISYKNTDGEIAEGTVVTHKGDTCKGPKIICEGNGAKGIMKDDLYTSSHKISLLPTCSE